MPWRVVFVVAKPSAAQDGIRKAKAQIELNLARNSKNYRKGLYWVRRVGPEVLYLLC